MSQYGTMTLYYNLPKGANGQVGPQDSRPNITPIYLKF